MKRSLLILLLTLFQVAVAVADGEGSAPEGEGDLLDYEQVSPSEDGLVLIEVPGVASQDFMARFTGDTLYVPFIAFCDFLRIKSSITPDALVMSGQVGMEKAFEISRVTSTADVEGKIIPFNPALIRVVGGDIYIEQALLARILGVTSFFDPMRLKLRVTPDERIPLVKLKHNKGRYAALSFEERLPGIPMQAAEMGRKAISGPMLNWSLSNSFNPGSNGATTMSIRLGQQALFGTLEMNGIMSHTQAGSAATFDARLESWSWRFQEPTSPFFKQLIFGTLNIADRRRYGVEITNAPLAPRIGFSMYNLTGLTRPDWTVEMYDGNRLVDVVHADSAGRYTFRVPVSYGTVDRVLRQIGPNGEEIFENRRLEINQQMLPAGEVEYLIQGGADSLDRRSSGGAVARLNAGVTEWLTLGTEATYRAPNVDTWSADSVDPAANATLWFGGSTSVGLKYQVRSRIVAGDFYTISSDNTMIRVGVDSLLIDDATFRSTVATNLAVGQLSFGGSVMYGRRSWGDEFQVVPQVSGYAAGINFIASTRFTRASIKGMVEESITNDIASSLRLMISPVNGALISAGASYDHTDNQLSTLDLSAYYRFSDHVGVNIGYTVPDLDWRRGMLQASVALDLNSLRATASTTYREGHMEASSFAQGSAVVTGQGVRTFSDLTIGQAAIIVQAFRDENNNGIHDSGEEWLSSPPARMTVSGSSVTAQEGLFRAVPANRECMVEIDRWDYADENIYPSRTRFSIYSLPSGVHTIEVPYAEGNDVTGTCKVEGETEAKSSAFVNGLRVQLLSEKSGAIYDGEIFSDGTMFFAGVTAGEFRLKFDDDQLTSRRLCRVSGPETVTLDGATTRIPEGIVFKRCTK